MTAAETGPSPCTLDFFQDGTLVFSASGEPIWANDGLRLMLGLGVGTDLPPAADILSRIQFEAGLSVADVLILIGESSAWRGVAEGRRVDDRPVSLEVKGRRLDEAAGGQAGSVLEFRDGSRVARTDRRVLEVQQMELSDRLLRGMAHEFKNLLTIIMAYCSLLELQLESSGCEEDLAKIMETADRANEVVGRFTAVTRMPRSESQTADMAVVMKNVLALLAKTMPSHVTLTSDDWGPLPMVRVDDGALTRAVMHLALNAFDAMPDEGELTLHAGVIDLADGQAVTTPGTYFALTVGDTGVGISPDIRARLFEPFYSTRETGTGLGLCYVRSLMHAAGGGITVSSDPGEGTTVSLYVPVVD